MNKRIRNKKHKEKALVVLENQGLTTKQAKAEYSHHRRLYENEKIDNIKLAHELVHTSYPIDDIISQIEEHVHRHKSLHKFFEGYGVDINDFDKFTTEQLDELAQAIQMDFEDVELRNWQKIYGQLPIQTMGSLLHNAMSKFNKPAPIASNFKSEFDKLVNGVYYQYSRHNQQIVMNNQGTVTVSPDNPILAGLTVEEYLDML